MIMVRILYSLVQTRSHHIDKQKNKRPKFIPDDPIFIPIYKESSLRSE
jgi:hypothetical protein